MEQNKAETNPEEENQGTKPPAPENDESKTKGGDDKAEEPKIGWGKVIGRGFFALLLVVAAWGIWGELLKPKPPRFRITILPSSQFDTLKLKISPLNDAAEKCETLIYKADGWGEAGEVTCSEGEQDSILWSLHIYDDMLRNLLSSDRKLSLNFKDDKGLAHDMLTITSEQIEKTMLETKKYNMSNTIYGEFDKKDFNTIEDVKRFLKVFRKFRLLKENEIITKEYFSDEFKYLVNDNGKMKKLTYTNGCGKCTTLEEINDSAEIGEVIFYIVKNKK